MSCRICGNTHGNVKLTAKNMRSPEKEGFSYLQCQACGSVCIEEVPKNLSKYYENYYSFGPVRDKMPFLERLLKHSLLNKNRLAGKLLNTSIDLALHAIASAGIDPADNILDVGCGSGQLVVDLRNLGFSNVEGLDPYLDADLHYANGARISKKSFFEEQRKWDLIMFNHVFEHLDQQREVLKHAAKILSPHGKLLIRIPNVDSYAFRKYREHWYGMQAPVHLALPSKKGMEILLKSLGLKIEKLGGENVVEFWAHSEAYALNIWDYDDLGIRTYLKDCSLKMRKTPKLFTKNQMKDFRDLNRKVQAHPELCDWVAYYVVKDPAYKPVCKPKRPRAIRRKQGCVKNCVQIWSGA